MRLLFALGVWISAVLGPGAADGGEAYGQSRACVVSELSRRPLVLDGRHETYVEPETLVRAGDAVLLAGSPTYVLRRGPGGEAVSLVRDSLIGVVLEPGGAARAVSGPSVAGTTIEWRAVALGERLWGVSFSELPSSAGGSVGTHVDGRLWFGTLRDGRWTSVSRIPLPEGWELLPFSASKLVRRGDTLALAVSMDSATAGRRVVLLERRQGRWSHRMLPFGAAYVDLAYEEPVGFLAAIVRSDSSVTSGGNALSLWVPEKSGVGLRRIFVGGPGGMHEPAFGVHEPALTVDSGTVILTWWSVVHDPNRSRFQAYARVDPLASPPGPVLALDPNVDSIVYVPTRQAVNLWLSDHVVSDTSRELRLLEASDGPVRVLWRAPNPYDGAFRTVALTGGHLLLVGPSFDRSHGVLASLILHIELECDAPS